jgi:hypothetical protein
MSTNVRWTINSTQQNKIINFDILYTVNNGRSMIIDVSALQTVFGVPYTFNFTANNDVGCYVQLFILFKPDPLGPDINILTRTLTFGPGNSILSPITVVPFYGGVIHHSSGSTTTDTRWLVDGSLILT